MQHLVLSLSLAYWMYDTVCCLLVDYDAASTAHHLLTCFGLAVGYRGHSGAELTLCLLLMEVR